MITIEQEKMEDKEYVRIVFETIIKRKGKEKLLAVMEDHGYFRVPASTKHHLNVTGGLARHSINVTNRMLNMPGMQEYELESIMICGLLHDLCKMDAYKLTPAGWTYNEEKFPMGHGEKSVFIIMNSMKLTDEEALAIRWHMGGWDDAVKGGCREQTAAFEQSKLAVALHIADMQATWMEER